MSTSINHGQYESVFTQVLDGELINHRNEPIPEVNPRIKREFEPKSNLAYKELDGESTRRADFKREQLEYEKKIKSDVYKENMKDIQQALAVSDVFLAKIGSLQTS